MKYYIQAHISLLLFTLFTGSLFGQSKDSWTENFDIGLATSYTNGTQTLATGDWTTQQVYQETSSASFGSTGHAARINDDVSGANITTPPLNTCGTISFVYRELNTGGGTFEVLKSYDNISWTSISTQTFSGINFQTFNFDVNDESSPVYIRVLNDNNPGHLIIDNFSVTDYSSSIPLISVDPALLDNFTYTIGGGPSSSQSFNASGTDLTNDIIVSPPVNYEISINNTSFQSSDIVLAQSAGIVNPTTIYVRLKAGLASGSYSEQINITSTGATTKTVNCSGVVLAPEPTNNPSGLTATANSSSQITVTWSDSDAAHYLLKGSNVSYAAIENPLDGVAEANSLLVQNTDAGVEIYQFSGLSQATHYYFKIFGYNGSNGTINYKVDGAPQTDAITEGTGNTTDLVITEVMQNPAAVADADGEWFEIYNGGSSAVDLNGWIIKDLGSDSHTINNGGPLIISAGGFLVFGINANTGTNGGVNVDYQYSGFTLGNSDDEILLVMSDGTTIIDEIAYDGGPNWPDPNGASMSLNPSKFNTTDNDTGTNWFESVTPYGSGDLGTPGAMNEGLFTTWTGAISSDWNDTGNWDNGVPAADQDVLIPDVSGAKAPNPIVTSGAVCNDIVIENGGSLEIEVSGSLTVNGSFTNDGTVNIRSDATGNGSLIESSGINATVEAFIPQGRWNFVGLPIDDANTSVFAGLFMQWWNEVDGVWEWVVSADSILSTDLMGYSVWPSSDATLNFTGTLNSGTRSLAITNSPGSAFPDKGYNLVGNPYPSSVNWDGTGWTKTNVDNAIYTWTGAQYASYVSGISVNGLTNIIPPHQGFFVHCNNVSGGLLEISDASRTHTNVANLKNTNSPESLLLTVQGNGYKDETAIYINEGATNGFDEQYDAYKLKGNPDNPQLFSVADDGFILSINAMGTVPIQPLNLSFEPGMDGIFELSLSNISGFEGIPVFLEDKKEHSIINLKSNPVYKFTGSTLDNVSRFKLYFSYNETPASDDYSNTDGLFIYSKNQNVIISSEKLLWGKAILYDLSGRQVISTDLNGEMQKVLNPKNSGYYIVSVITNEKINYRKVYLK